MFLGGDVRARAGGGSPTIGQRANLGTGTNFAKAAKLGPVPGLRRGRELGGGFGGRHFVLVLALGIGALGHVAGFRPFFEQILGAAFRTRLREGLRPGHELTVGVTGTAVERLAAPRAPLADVALAALGALHSDGFLLDVFAGGVIAAGGEFAEAAVLQNQVVATLRALLVEGDVGLLLLAPDALGGLAVRILRTREERTKTALFEHHRASTVLAEFLFALVVEIRLVHIGQIHRQFAGIGARIFFPPRSQRDTLSGVPQFEVVEIVYSRVPAVDRLQTRLDQAAILRSLLRDALLERLQQGCLPLAETGDGPGKPAFTPLDRHLGMPRLEFRQPGRELLASPFLLAGNLPPYLLQIGFHASGGEIGISRAGDEAAVLAPLDHQGPATVFAGQAGWFLHPLDVRHLLLRAFQVGCELLVELPDGNVDRKSTRLNSSH